MGPDRWAFFSLVCGPLEIDRVGPFNGPNNGPMNDKDITVFLDYECFTVIKMHLWHLLIE